jgi:hypothetical protein
MAYADLILSDAPVAYYRLGESAGTQATDSSGNALHGVYTAGYTLAQTGALSGDSDTAIVLNGSTGYIDLDYKIGLALDGAVGTTVEAWVKVTDFTGDMAILSFRIDGTNTGLDFLIRSVQTIRAAGRSQIADSYQTKEIAFTTAGVWRHVVGILDYANDQIKIYIDGIVKLSEAVTFGSSTFVLGTPTQEDRIGASPAGSTFFKGAVDEIAVYDFVLSPAQISAHYATGKELCTNRAVRSPKTGLYSIHHLGI